MPFVKCNIKEEIEKDIRENPKAAFLYQITDKEFELVAFLVKERKRQGLTQEQISKKTGLKQPAISRLETVGNKPSVNSLLKYLAALDINLMEAINFYQENREN